VHTPVAVIGSILVSSAAPNVLTDVGGDPDDAVLVRRCLASDLRMSERASELLFARHQKPVFELALYMLCNIHDAEDAAQVTFEKVFKNLCGYRSKGSLQAWVMGICRNHCIDRLRSPARARMSLDPFDESGLVAPAAVVDQDLSITLWMALKTLPLDEREAVIFVKLLGFTSHEAAQAIGVRASTIRSRVGRASAKLEVELRENRGSAIGPPPKPNILYELPSRVPDLPLPGAAVPPEDELARLRAAP